MKTNTCTSSQVSCTSRWGAPTEAAYVETSTQGGFERFVEHPLRRPRDADREGGGRGRARDPSPFGRSGRWRWRRGRARARRAFRARPRTEPRLFAYIEAHLQNAVDALTRSDELVEIRDAVAKNVAIQEYGAKALASRLRLSLRALQREVSRHGTTVRALLDEARCAQAKRLLQDRRLSVDEIAFVLSYSDERAFRRAFKRMTGESPAQFRRRQSLS
ncbi:MAG: helix-turn-helix domain-containing protein [Deltaproteobacteria bacterium]